jgi:polyisoprenoid-binding protein YceI
MNKTALTIITVLIAVVALFFIFGNGDGQDSDQSATTTPPTETATSTATSSENTSDQLEKGTYTIDTEKSTVEWTAYKTLVDGYEDVGTFPVTDGQITVGSDGSISANVTLDIANLNVISVSGPGSTDRLASHLRSEDFFDTQQYPTSTLRTTAITQATSSANTYNVTADLTMKGQTNEITFPAQIGMEDGGLTVQADTEIDRSRWNIRYGSPSFFNDLGDNAIGDMVDISVDLTAEKGTAGMATTTNTTN